MAVQISPSILSADFARLADEARAIETAADWLHVDVMDNHFVPNLTIGLPVVESLLKHVTLPIDCHLMIDDPDRHAPGYAEAGAGTSPFTRKRPRRRSGRCARSAPRAPAPGSRSIPAPRSSRTRTCSPNSTCCC